MLTQLLKRVVVLAASAALLGAGGSGMAQPAAGKAQEIFAQGFELLKGGKYRDAIARFEAGLKADPNNALAHFYLGESYLGAGQGAAARPHYARSLALDPNGQNASEARTRLSELSKAPAPSAAPPDSTPARSSGPSAGSVFKDCDVCPEMVVVPPGEFIMGSPPSEPGRFDNEGPPHIVKIARAFAAGKFEVTFAQWDACVADRACGTADDRGWGRGSRPVINVSYEQAVGFTEWLSDKTRKKYRLLSEAEWEYAARAGSDRARFWGSAPDRACQFANVRDESFKRGYKGAEDTFGCDDGYEYTAPVGSFKPNDFGLHDMLGNVFEWVEDCYNGTYAGAPADGRVWGTGDCKFRVVRGGSWFNKPRRPLC